jgi:tetratricopeptide (TPR) repeat protein/transcriptional regulator with XRE-family HTH domain
VTDSNLTFGGVLRARRRAAGLSQPQLAEASGLSVRAIGDLERGRTRRPYPDSLRRLADALDLRGRARAEFFTGGQELAGQPGTAPASGTARAHPAAVVPRQLPAQGRHFSGRSAELARLAGLQDQAGQEGGQSMVIAAIGGLPGVGKTALALQVARQLVASFPDGQLYVNLRGFDPALPPVLAADAIRVFLDAFEIPADRIPYRPDAQAGLYRSVMAGKKALVVLDNAADAAQVRALLPGSSGCLVIVTSRNQLAGLVAIDGAVPLSLDVLTAADALDLLCRVLGAGRIDAEPAAAGQLIELCGRLPLALAIAAARAATVPRLPLAELAAELADAAGRLDALQSGGDPLASVRAVLQCSYEHLDPEAARMLRLLGMHPGPDISVAAAASLAGLPGPRAARHLAELAAASLVSDHGAGRYALHDLVRLYAAERALRTDSEAERGQATGRVLDHYLHTGHAAARLLRPGRDPLSFGEPSPGAVPEEPADYQAAMAWFEAEHRVLVAATRHAHACGHDLHAWTIAWTLQDYFYYRSYWRDRQEVSAIALAAAERLGDLGMQATSHEHLGHIARQTGHYDDASFRLGRALDLRRQTGDQRGQGTAHLVLAALLARQDQYHEAIDHARQALELFAATGDLNGQANSLNGVGWYLIQLGDYRPALTHCQQALTLCREMGNRHNEAATLDSLAFAYHQLGQYGEAVSHYLQAVEIAAEFGFSRLRADMLGRLGDSERAAGHVEAARKAWQDALVILDDLQVPDAAAVRAKLDALQPDIGLAPAPDPA